MDTKELLTFTQSCHSFLYFVPLCYPMHFALPRWPRLSLCDCVTSEINFNLPHSMSICLWHRAIVGYIREVKIAAVKKAYESHSHESRLFRQRISSFYAT